MRTCLHDLQRSVWSSEFSLRVIRTILPCLLLLALSVGGLAQQPNDSSSSTSTGGNPSPSEGIQKHSNEFGVWGGLSFSAPTLIGKTPDARFGNIGLRYGRVLAASKTVAFEWTIDVIPVAVLSNNRFTVVPSVEQTLRVRRAAGAGDPHDNSHAPIIRETNSETQAAAFRLPPRATLRPSHGRLPLLQRTSAGRRRRPLQLHLRLQRRRPDRQQQPPRVYDRLQVPTHLQR